MILRRSFYQRGTVTVSKDLLGKILVYESSQDTTAGRIVETESQRGSLSPEKISVNKLIA